MLAFYLSLVPNGKDQSKVELIYTSFREYMTYRAYEKVKNKSDAEDAVHEAMLRIIKHIDKVDVSDKVMLKSFCGKVAENAAKDINRKRGSAVEEFPLEEIEEVPADDSELPDNLFFTKEAYDSIRSEVAELSDCVRDVCTLKFVQGFNDLEIADLLCMNYKTVSVYASRGRNAIKTALRKVGFHE